MWRRRLICGLTALLAAAPPALAGLDELARAGRWAEVLQLARLRVHQLPLQPDEALVAAEAARRHGDLEACAAFLELAAEGEGLGAVAQVELAELLAAVDPPRSVDLALPLIRSAPSPQLRAAAQTAAARAVRAGVGEEERSAVRRAASRLRRDSGRELELALALTDEAGRRRGLARLLEGSTSDGVALEATRALVQDASLAQPDRWHVARAFYRHALYDEAVVELDRLEADPHASVPAWEVAFVQGRCAFRLDRWDEAATWYRSALSRTAFRRRRAELEVHLARALELGGEEEEALAAARRAFKLHSTDDRRLLLVRLHLRAGSADEAATVAGGIRSHSKRDRARLLLALDDLGGGRPEEASGILSSVRRTPWRGPARVLAAAVAAAAGDEEQAVALLDLAAEPWMSWYWAGAARRVMSSLAPERRTAWSGTALKGLEALEGKAWRRAAAGWASLESDRERLEAASVRLRDASGLAGTGGPPAFTPGVAGDLWRLGLTDRALRWDPGGFPRATPAAALWTAQRLIESGQGREATRIAERVREEVANEVPWWVLPDLLKRALFPLPRADLVAAAAAESGVPWPLLAAVAHVESRWEDAAVSVVGARGLSQLMPATARRAAESLGLDRVEPDALFDPALSLRLGAAELARLLEAFGGRRAPTVAAYNAGEAQARLWLESCGDACRDELYVLTIAFDVTRGYTAEVLTAAGAYELLYGERMNALMKAPERPDETPASPEAR